MGKLLIMMLFLIFICTYLQGCDQDNTVDMQEPHIYKSTEHKVSPENETSPIVLLLIHIGPQRKPIWPLIWYADDSGIEMAKAKVEEFIRPYCVEEKVQEHQLARILEEAKQFNLEKPNGSFGTSELTFWWNDNTSQCYIIDIKGMNSIYKKLDGSIPQESYFRDYLVRIGVIPFDQR